MKTLQKVPFELVEVEFIPEQMEPNKMYYSEKYNCANHLCACGCGTQCPIIIKEGEWQILDKVKLTIQPSLHHKLNCRSHYIITNGFANIVNHPLEKEHWNKSGHTHAPGSCPL